MRKCKEYGCNQNVEVHRTEETKTVRACSAIYSVQGEPGIIRTVVYDTEPSDYCYYHTKLRKRLFVSSLGQISVFNKEKRVKALFEGR